MTAPARYHVTHETLYAYGGDVAYSHQVLHLTPRPLAWQECLNHELQLWPTPAVRRDALDAFGNRATRLEFDRLHNRLEVSASMEISVEPRPAAVARDSDTVEKVRHSLMYVRGPMPPERLEAMRYRLESPYVRIKHAFTEYAAAALSPERPILEGVDELLHKIHREFAYSPGATRVDTPLLEVLGNRRGVCQDFSHLMIACLRSHGLAARYVSGYLRTATADRSSLVGADASHAWVSVYCPPLGWVDVDPTNGVRAGLDHITIAWGRDFGDVSPLRGVIVGGGHHELTVRVGVLPLASGRP
jgi:transglutaminase-like putative cysteine protease